MKWILLALLCSAASALAQRAPIGATVASFAGSGQDSIQAMVADAQGNIYIAGTTTSPNLPVVAAWQPQIAGSSAMFSSDSGAAWTSLASPPASLYAIQPDPMDPQVAYAVSETAIFKTIDAGQSWESVFAGPISLSDEEPVLAIDPGNTKRLAALAPAGFLISLDAGLTWASSAVPANLGCNHVAADPAGSGLLLLGCSGGLVFSRDWGVTFDSSSSPAPGSGGESAAFDPFHTGWIYAAVGSVVTGRMYLSTDYGQTWTEKNVPTAAFSVLLHFAADPDEPNVWYGANAAGQLWASPDGMSTWALLDPPTPLYNFARFAVLSRTCTPVGGIFTIGKGLDPNGPIQFSADFGFTWQTTPFGNVDDIATGPGCAVYAARQISSDAFVAKIAPDGKVLWATYLGGSDVDAAQSVALDGSGNLLVLGSTRSTDFPATAPRIGVQGAQNVFLTKFDPSGTQLSSVLIGGEGDDTPSAVTVGADGSVYFVGQTTSQRFPVMPGAYLTQSTGGSEGFIVKIGANLQLLYSSYLDGQNPAAVAVDATGQATVGGSLLASAGGSEGFLIRLDPTGSQITYSSNVGVPAALTVDTQGNLYVEGTTSDANFPTTPGAFVSPLRHQPCPSAAPETFGEYSYSDLFVMKLASGSFQPVYAALLGSACASTAGSLNIDNSGVATFSTFTGVKLPLRGPYDSITYCVNEVGSLYSGAIAQLSPDGSTLLFSTYIPMCGVPPFAVYPEAAIFAGINATHTSIQEFRTAPHPGPPIRR